MPEPLTNLETTSSLLPNCDVPFEFGPSPCEFSRESEVGRVVVTVAGVAVVRDILVVLCDGVRWRSRSVMIFASAVGWRVLCEPFAGAAAGGGLKDSEGDSGWELLALCLAELGREADLDKAGEAVELASSHASSGSGSSSCSCWPPISKCTDEGLFVGP